MSLAEARAGECGALTRRLAPAAPGHLPTQVGPCPLRVSAVCVELEARLSIWLPAMPAGAAIVRQAGRALGSTLPFALLLLIGEAY
jgi:hypothetical protein